MIDRETYMSASQAIEAGFLDSVVGGDTSMQDKVEAEFQAFLAEAHKPRAQVPDDPLPRRPGYSLPEAEMDAELEGEQARFLRAFERWHAENGGAALGAENLRAAAAVAFPGSGLASAAERQVLEVLQWLARRPDGATLRWACLDSTGCLRKAYVDVARAARAAGAPRRGMAVRRESIGGE